MSAHDWLVLVAVVLVVSLGYAELWFWKESQLREAWMEAEIAWDTQADAEEETAQWVAYAENLELLVESAGVDYVTISTVEQVGEVTYTYTYSGPMANLLEDEPIGLVPSDPAYCGLCKGQCTDESSIAADAEAASVAV